MKKLIIAAVAALSVGLGFAGSDEDEAKVGYSPLGIGFVTPAQYPSARSNIYGLRLSLPMSINKDVCGLDLGVVGLTSGGIYGLQVTPFNWSDGGAYGMQIAGLANVSCAVQYGSWRCGSSADWRIQLRDFVHWPSDGRTQLELYSTYWQSDWRDKRQC